MLHVYCLNALSENRQIAPSEPGPGFGKPAGLFDPRWGGGPSRLSIIGGDGGRGGGSGR
jgi:hypothetical protein